MPHVRTRHAGMIISSLMVIPGLVRSLVSQHSGELLSLMALPCDGRHGVLALRRPACMWLDVAASTRAAGPPDQRLPR